MTGNGGTYNNGRVFSFATIAVVGIKTRANGAFPYGTLTLSGRVFYGMTDVGGLLNYGLFLR